MTGTAIGPRRVTSSYADKYNIIGFRVASIAELPGDFNHDGTVDAADYVVWRKTEARCAGYDTGEPTSANRPAAARQPVQMPPFPNRQRWCC